MAVLMTGLLVACDEDFETAVYDQDVATAAVLTTPGSTLVLDANSADNLIQFEWTHAEFGYSAAITYELQMDIAGKSFANKTVLTSLPVNKETETMVYDITVKDFNTALLKHIGKYEDLDAAEPVEFEFRVVSSISSEVELNSGVQTSLITVYSGALPSIYMVGEGVGGWDLGKAVEVFHAGQPDTYHTKAYFYQANFRFFNQPDWSTSIGGYDVFTNYPEEYLAVSTDGDPNFAFIGAEGWYEIVVNVASGSIELTPISDPSMYLTGSATHGWDWDEPVTAIKWVNYNRWEGDVAFIQNEYFRLFAQKDWGPTSYGYDTVTNYDTSVIIIAEGHGDPNWQFIAPSGTYHVVLDLEAKSIEITPL